MRRNGLSGACAGIVVTVLAGLLGVLMAGGVAVWDVYSYLYLPVLAPSFWVFAVVWLCLWALAGIAAYLVQSEPGPADPKGSALLLYALHLVLCMAWCVVFFRWQYYWTAVLFLLLLDLVLFTAMRRFAAISAGAAALLFPYLLWTLYSTYFTLGVALIN